MTDQKSDRPGGDGLLIKALGCSLYNFDSVEFVECKHAVWNEILERLGVPSPTRDGAEGAVDAFTNFHGTDIIFESGMPTAPPKPAPDAVRTWENISEDDPDVVLVAHAIAEHGIGRPWDDFLPCNAFDVDRGDLTEYARAAVAALRAKSAAWWQNPDPWPLCDDRGDDDNPEPSPSPAVAAEPVAIGEQEILDEARSRYARHGRFQRVFVEGAGWGVKNRAIPPVRGDRGTIARAICEADGHDYDRERELASKFESASAREIINRAHRYADAILSLPVQPATRPDREALAQAYALHRWKEKLENLPDDMKDDCYNFSGALVGVQPGGHPRDRLRAAAHDLAREANTAPISAEHGDRIARRST